MSSLSTHVLDAVNGNPAEGVSVTLFAKNEDDTYREMLTERTDADGRIGRLHPDLGPGIYRIVFDTGTYFVARGLDTFYPEVVITFLVDEERHYHVPALLSPFAYSTYRGS